MTYRKFELIFNRLSPISLRGVVWLLILFFILIILDGWEMSLKYIYVVLVLLFDIIFGSIFINYLADRTIQFHKVILSTKNILSISIFNVLNSVLFVVSGWKIVVLLFLIPIPIWVILYLYRRRGG